MTSTAGLQRGAEAASTLRASLTAVARCVPYLTAEVGAVPLADIGPGATEEAPDELAWLRSSQLLDDAAPIAEILRRSGDRIGTDDLVVAASIFVQGYAYRLLALGVATMTTQGVVPDCAPELTAVAVSRGRPSRVAYLEPAVLTVTDDPRSAASALADPDVADAALSFVIDRAITDHLGPLIRRVRQEVRIGERLLWGNVAASAATAFRTMEGCHGSWVIPLGNRFFELAPPPLRGQGTFLLIEHDGRRGWFWERVNCCLFDRLPGNIRCADCSRTPATERRAAYEEAVRSAPVSS